MILAGKWRVAQASVIGQSHLNQNTVCQDRLATSAIKNKLDGEVLIAVVADGAGSTTNGQRGAEIACEFFISQVSEFVKKAAVKSLTEDFGKRWIEFFQSKIAEMAGEEKKEMREYATTFVAAVVGKNEAVFYQVGDGGAVFSTCGKPESYQFSIAPVEAEYVNQTEFLTDDAAADSLRFVHLAEAVEDLILFSDGIFAVAVNYQTGKPHEPFLMPMIAPLRSGSEGSDLNEKLEKFLASPKLNEKTDDDKTIILASRRLVKDEG
ncbi:MAG: protein phosphatase 2C domain-containing protein [Acidobacteriota bacterium]|nr:protein phosphatase 2C domain-containing protein [Acidobacteriota bacterium]